MGHAVARADARRQVAQSLTSACLMGSDRGLMTRTSLVVLACLMAAADSWSGALVDSGALSGYYQSRQSSQEAPMLERWPLQDAKNRFSELVETVLEDGPQVVTRRGVDTVVIVPAATYRSLTLPKGSLAQFFADSPLRGARLNLSRDADLGRGISL
jgi:prevent-host-death family protein